MIRRSIPSFLTSLNVLCGFSSLLVEPKIGIILILIGGIFDVFDGAVAKVLNAQSEFGKQLDSLADIISFAVAPAFILSQFIEEPYHYFVCIIPVFGAIRLAKFNLEGESNYWFEGMPTPASAMLYLGIVIAILNGLEIPTLLILLIIAVVSLLNVSPIAMFSFKGIRKDNYTSIFIGLCILAGLLVSFYNINFALLAGMITYVVLCFVYYILLKSNSKV